MTNVVLLEKTMQRIERGADWCQTNWCRCFAGNALRELGFEVYDSKVPQYSTPLDGWNVTDRDGETRGIKDVAQRELGLTDEQADELFNACNRMWDLRAIVNSLIEQAVGDEILQTMTEPQLV